MEGTTGNNCFWRRRRCWEKTHIRLINRAEIFKPIRGDSREKEHFVRLGDFMTGMNANVFRENPLVTAVQCPTSFP